MKISVIIPAYNRAQYIEESINSVLGQITESKFDLEIIVVDDGSTDNTSKIVKKFGRKIIYICIPHTGKPAVARNVGIKKATGELIAFQDSDDIWAKDRLISQLPYFEDAKVTLVHGAVEHINNNGKPLDNLRTPRTKINETRFDDLLGSNSISTLTVTVRADTIRKVGGFNEADSLRAVEDYELWLRIAADGGRIICMPKTLASYRVHDANISNFGLAPAGTSEYQIQALARILRVYEYVLISDDLSKNHIKATEAAIEEQVDRISMVNNPNFVGRTPTVSVILPAYNAENFIRQTIESILSQTFRDFELLIFDDGSKDKTAEVIRSFNDPRIKFYRQRNMGLLDTCNKGIRLARAPLIARHDADDISLPSRFEKEVILLTARPEVGLVSTYFTYMDEHSEAKSITMAYPFKSIDVKRSFYSVNSIAHGGAMIRKSVLEEVGGYPSEFTPAEDYHLWTKIAEVSEVAIIPESLYWYRISSGGMAATRYDELIVTAAGIAEEYWKQKFKSKRLLALLKDARYYRTLDSPYSQLIYEQYLAHQKFIRSALYQKHKIFSAMKMSIALIFIDLKPLRKPLALYRRAVKKAYRMTVGRKRSKINR